jgi:hypothetical protein
MGGEPYWYFVPYDSDVQRALDALRAREFQAGRYNPVVPFLHFDDERAFLAQRPGPRHASIDKALAASGESGTRSILDIATVRRAPDYGVAAPFADSLVRDVFGTMQPSRSAVETSLDRLLEVIPRGQCLYLVAYADRDPAELFFAGYSYD